MRYQIELGIYPDGPFVSVNTIYVHDLPGEVRTNVPTVYAHGDRPTAAQLNALAGSFNDSYPASDRESPIWESHLMQPYQRLRPAPPPPTEGETYIRGLHHYRVRLLHRWRYLRYRCDGSVRMLNPDGSLTYRLPDTEGQSAVIDLETVPWLSYGMEYELQDEDEGWLMCAYEDYA